MTLTINTDNIFPELLCDSIVFACSKSGNFTSRQKRYCQQHRRIKLYQRKLTQTWWWYRVNTQCDVTNYNAQRLPAKVSYINRVYGTHVFVHIAFPVTFYWTISTGSCQMTYNRQDLQMVSPKLSITFSQRWYPFIIHYGLFIKFL